MIVWEPNEGRAQFVRFLSRTRKGLELACSMLGGPYTVNVSALAVEKEYKFLSRWFPTHVTLRDIYNIRPQYKATSWLTAGLENFVGISRRSATRQYANGSPFVRQGHTRLAGQRRTGSKDSLLISVFLPMHLSMITDLEMCLDSVTPTMQAPEILDRLEQFFSTHVLHDEQVEVQHQVLLDPIDGFHNDFRNAVLSQLTRTLTICLI